MTFSALPVFLLAGAAAAPRTAAGQAHAAPAATVQPVAGALGAPPVGLVPAVSVPDAVQLPLGIEARGPLEAPLESAPAPAVPALAKEYQIGGNNRRIVSTILEDLEQRYGVMVVEDYGDEIEVKDDKLYLSEAEMDRYLDIIRRTQEIMAKVHKLDFDPERDLFPHWEAMLRFLVAHEYFHLALMHPDVLKGRLVEGFTTNVRGSEFKRWAELQANYLAADYLEELGLPTKFPAIFLHGANWDLETGEELDHPDYPPGWMQREVVEMPKARIHWGLFRNAKLDASALVRKLEGIRDGRERVLKRILYLLDRELERFEARKRMGLEDPP